MHLKCSFAQKTHFLRLTLVLKTEIHMPRVISNYFQYSEQDDRSRFPQGNGQGSLKHEEDSLLSSENKPNRDATTLRSHRVSPFAYVFA